MQGQGAIVEVNAGPGLLMHLKPAEGRPAPWAGHRRPPVPPKRDGRRRPHPRGRHGGHTQQHLHRPPGGWLLQLSGKLTGWPAAKAVPGSPPHRDQYSAHWAAHRLLMNRLAQAAVIENTPA
jgi:cyanophycin synthetase